MKFINILLAALVALTMFALMGCPPKDTPKPVDEIDSGTQSGQDDVLPVAGGPDDTAVAQTPDGQTTVTPEGVVVTTGANALPAGWPADVPVMEGFTIVSTEENPAEKVMSVTSEGTVPLPDARAFYQALPGWQQDINKDFTLTGDNVQILTFVKEDLKLAVTIAKDESKNITVLVLAISQKPK